VYSRAVAAPTVSPRLAPGAVPSVESGGPGPGQRHPPLARGHLIQPRRSSTALGLALATQSWSLTSLNSGVSRSAAPYSACAVFHSL